MEMQQVSSSNIHSVGYDEENRLLSIEFHSGGIYQYSNVPEAVHRGLMCASSKGSYFQRFIKDHYTFRQMR